MSRPGAGKPPDPPGEDPGLPGLIAPTQEAWAAMSAAEKERFLLDVIDAHSDPEEAMSEGRPHKRAKSRADARRAAAEAEVAALLPVVREAIALLLNARQIAVPDQVRAAVLACEDPAVLAELLRRAATITDPRALLTS